MYIYIYETTLGVIKGDTRSLDYSSCVQAQFRLTATFPYRGDSLALEACERSLKSTP